MISHLGYKILSTCLALIVVVIVIAYSPKAYDPILAATSTLDFANTAAGAATDLTVNITGAVDGDPVMIGVPNGSTVANGHFVGWVSSTGVVTVRFLNNNLVAALNPASGTFKVAVLKK
jgi:hypothetical protein